MATVFGWKKKIPQNVSRKRPRAFDETEQKDDPSSINEPLELDWGSLIKRNTSSSLLEDNESKSRRLKAEGVVLAEEERYWEAIGHWNEATNFTPKDETLYEMKAQALLELKEIFPAVQAAKSAVELNPRWSVAHQTLGRTQLGLGEVEMALRSFSKAVHLTPDNEEMWKDDLIWAQNLREQGRKRNCEADGTIPKQVL